MFLLLDGMHRWNWLRELPWSELAGNLLVLLTGIVLLSLVGGLVLKALDRLSAKAAVLCWFFAMYSLNALYFKYQFFEYARLGVYRAVGWGLLAVLPLAWLVLRGKLASLVAWAP
ncbi:MAG: hypothetical protein AB1758_38255, partial [Candidatus Eremiobacterota bacterium]